MPVLMLLDPVSILLLLFLCIFIALQQSFPNDVVTHLLATVCRYVVNATCTPPRGLERG